MIGDFVTTYKLINFCMFVICLESDDVRTDFAGL